MSICNKPRLIDLLLISFMLLPAWATAQTTFNGIVTFGDSVSDSGNKYAITGFSNTPPYDLLDNFLVPEGPYTRGGLHHSNGATWIEQLAKPLGLGGDVRPALRSAGRAMNYAYGGARARNALVSPNKHLPQQVTDYLADVNLNPPADALYVIFIGSIDVADAVRALQVDPTGATSVGIVTDAVVAVRDSIVALYNVPGVLGGARKFLIVNAPDLGLTPAFNPPLNIPAAAGYGTCFSLLYNLGTLSGSLPPSCAFPSGIPGLKDVLDGLELTLPGINFVRLDAFTAFHEIVAYPAQFGLKNVTDACVMPDQPPFNCKRPDEYLFWDGIHPTKAVHAILADKAAQALTQ